MKGWGIVPGGNAGSGGWQFEGRDPGRNCRGGRPGHGQIAKVVLFGSRARGDNDPKGDIDPAVFTDDCEDLQWTKFCDALGALLILLKLDIVKFRYH